jgi:hypothetical protein
MRSLAKSVEHRDQEHADDDGLKIGGYGVGLLQI